MARVGRASPKLRSLRTPHRARRTDPFHPSHEVRPQRSGLRRAPDDLPRRRWMVVAPSLQVDSPRSPRATSGTSARRSSSSWTDRRQPHPAPLSKVSFPGGIHLKPQITTGSAVDLQATADPVCDRTSLLSCHPWWDAVLIVMVVVIAMVRQVVETKAVTGTRDRLARVDPDEGGSGRSTAPVALLIIDHGFQGVDLRGDQAVELRSAVPHAGDVIHSQQILRLPSSDGLRDEILVSLGFARADDGIGAPVHDDERSGQMAEAILSSQVDLDVRRAVQWIPELDLRVGWPNAARAVRLVPSWYGIAKVTDEGVVTALPHRLGAEPAAVVVFETVRELHRDVVDVTQRRELRLRERRRQTLLERVPARVPCALRDDVVDARGDDVVVAHHPRHAAPLGQLRVVTEPGNAAVEHQRIRLDHPPGVVAAVGGSDEQRARGGPAVLRQHERLGVDRQLHETLA